MRLLAAARLAADAAEAAQWSPPEEVELQLPELPCVILPPAPEEPLRGDGNASGYQPRPGARRAGDSPRRLQKGPRPALGTTADPGRADQSR